MAGLRLDGIWGQIIHHSSLDYFFQDLGYWVPAFAGMHGKKDDWLAP